jgi:hypothetical protein
VSPTLGNPHGVDDWVQVMRGVEQLLVKPWELQPWHLPHEKLELETASSEFGIEA